MTTGRLASAAPPTAPRPRCRRSRAKEARDRGARNPERRQSMARPAPSQGRRRLPRACGHHPALATRTRRRRPALRAVGQLGTAEAPPRRAQNGKRCVSIRRRDRRAARGALVTLRLEASIDGDEHDGQRTAPWLPPRERRDAPALQARRRPLSCPRRIAASDGERADTSRRSAPRRRIERDGRTADVHWMRQGGSDDERRAHAHERLRVARAPRRGARRQQRPRMAVPDVLAEVQGGPRRGGGVARAAPSHLGAPILSSTVDAWIRERPR